MTNARPRSPSTAAPGQLITARDVAAILGVHLRTVWRLAQTGDIPQPVRISPRVLRWRAVDIDAHVDRLARDAAKQACSRSAS
jgi:predicted DNA-binding transcriptional regulator AlpA